MKRLVLACLCLAVLLVPTAALAQATTPSTISPSTLAWVTLAGLCVHFVASLLAPGTKPLPFELSATVRFWVMTGLSAVSGLLSLLQEGSTLQSAALATLGTLVTALIAHSPQMGGASVVRGAAAGAVLLFAGFTAACLTPAQSANAVQTVDQAFKFADSVCIAGVALAPLVDPSLPAATVAMVKQDCPEVASVADTLIDEAIQAFTKQPAAAAKAFALKRAAQARGQW